LNHGSDNNWEVDEGEKRVKRIVFYANIIDLHFHYFIFYFEKIKFMNQDHSFREHFNKVHQMLKDGYEMQVIESSLQQQGLDSLAIQDLFTAVRRLKNAKRTQNGNKLIVAGAILLVLGFGVCVALHYMDIPMKMALYGITLTGLTLLFAGLIKIFQ